MSMYLLMVTMCLIAGALLRSSCRGIDAMRGVASMGKRACLNCWVGKLLHKHYDLRLPDEFPKRVKKGQKIGELGTQIATCTHPDSRNTQTQLLKRFLLPLQPSQGPRWPRDMFAGLGNYSDLLQAPTWWYTARTHQRASTFGYVWILLDTFGYAYFGYFRTRLDTHRLVWDTFGYVFWIRADFLDTIFWIRLDTFGYGIHANLLWNHRVPHEHPNISKSGFVLDTFRYAG